jgi:ribosomal subunit interface protein
MRETPAVPIVSLRALLVKARRTDPATGNVQETDMKIPLQVTFRDMPSSDAVETRIREKADKLNRFYDRIMACRVVVEMPQRHKHQGKLHSVRIDLTVPGAELVANHARDEDVYVAIRDAFVAITRQLEDYARRQRGEVKSHANAGVP